MIQFKNLTNKKNILKFNLEGKLTQYSLCKMEEGLMGNLLFRQRKSTSLKEKLSKSSSRVSTFKSLYLFIQILFFNNSMIMFPINIFMG